MLEEQLTFLSTSTKSGNDRKAGLSPAHEGHSEDSHSMSKLDVDAVRQHTFANMMFRQVPSTSSLETPQCTHAPIDLPSLEDARQLEDIYFNHSNPQVPILSRERYQEYLQKAYSTGSVQSSDSKTAVFFVHIVSAIASAKNPSQILAEQHHASAMLHLPVVFKSASRLCSLTAVLLLSVYGTNRPSNPGIWYTLGVASRIITDLSLHTYVNTEMRSSREEEQLFWSWYCIDRQICVYLNRPVAISDNCIHTQIPQAFSAISIAFCRLRVMQSEIQRILHHADTLPREYRDLDHWRTIMHQRIEEWETSRPKNEIELGCEFNPAFLRLNYLQTVLLLHGFNTHLAPSLHLVLSSSKEILGKNSSIGLQNH